MTKINFYLYCVMFSLTTGFVWGCLIAMLHPLSGLIAGLVLTVLVFRVMTTNPGKFDDERDWNPRRRFND